MAILLSSTRIAPSAILGLLIFWILVSYLNPFHRTSSTSLATLLSSPFHRDESAVEQYDFVPTQAETDCLNPLGAHPNGSSLPPIPNVVHFIYGLDPATTELSWLAYLSIRAALRVLRPDVLKLHHAHLDPSKGYLASLGSAVTLVHHPRSSLFAATDPASRIRQPAHLADLLRLDVLLAEGGIYLDADVVALQSFDRLRNHASADVILGHEGGDRHGLCNAVIAARPGARFLRRWRDSYASFDAGEWNLHSVILPKQLAEENPGEVCTLAPTVWFWPTWSRKHVDYMHEPLDNDEARAVQLALGRNGGGLWPDQFAYHVWSQLAHRYTDRLDDDAVRAKDTRFNLMVRKFVGS